MPRPRVTSTREGPRTPGWLAARSRGVTRTRAIVPRPPGKGNRGDERAHDGRARKGGVYPRGRRILRATARLTEVGRQAVTGVLLNVGEGCRCLLDERMRDLHCDVLELDEVW